MPCIADLRTQYAQLRQESTALINGAEKITSEIRTKFEAMIADADNVAAVISQMEKEERTAAENRGRNLQLPNVGEHSPANADAETRSREVKASFRSWMRSGAVETRDLSGASTSVLVPQDFDKQLIEAKKSYGELVNIVDTMETEDQKPMRIVLDNDCANGLVAVSAGTDAAEVDPAVTSETLSVYPYTTGVVRVSLDVLNSSGFDVDSWVKDRFGVRYFRGLSNLIYNGDTNITGLAQTYTSGATSKTAGTLAYADLVSLAATVDPAYASQGVFAVNNNTLYAIAGMVDTNGRPLFIPFNDGAAGEFAGTILGKKVMLVTQMPNIASGNYSVLFGSFKDAYVLRTIKAGLSINAMRERYLPSYEIGFVGFASVGGITKNAGVSPLSALKIQ
jgi:HK97 family phage major capsid protein